MLARSVCSHRVHIFFFFFIIIPLGTVCVRTLYPGMCPCGGVQCAHTLYPGMCPCGGVHVCAKLSKHRCAFLFKFGSAGTGLDIITHVCIFLVYILLPGTPLNHDITNEIKLLNYVCIQISMTRTQYCCILKYITTKNTTIIIRCTC